jgi:hypothetical protein
VVNEEQINELSADTYKNTVKAALQRGDSKGNSIAVKALQSFGKEIAKELSGKSFEVKGSMKDVTKALYKGSSYSYINQVKMTFTGEGSLIHDNNVRVFGSDEAHFNMNVQFQLPDNIGGFSSDVKFRGYQNNKLPATIQFSIKGGKVWVWFKGADTDLEFTRAGAREMAKLADTIVAAMDFPTKAKHNTIKQFDAMKPTTESVNESKLSFSQLKKGQVLLNKFRSGRKYTIIDVDSKSATLKNLQTGNTIVIYSLNNYELKESVNESTPDQVIKDLDKAKNDLLKKVDALIAKKKKLYSDVDIEAPMSSDEKKLDKDIADLFSQINKLVLQKRSVKKESVNEEKVYIDFLNKKKGFKQDRIKFTSYEAAVKWAKKNFDNFNTDMIKYESVNEGKFSDIDIMAQEAPNFKEFVKEFYKEFRDFPKTKDSIKWLLDIYNGRTKMEGLGSDGLERVAQGLPQTEEEPITEKQLKGLEGISPNQTLDKISNADKLKIIKAPGNIITFFVPDWAKGSRNFWQVISTGKIKKNMSGEFGLEGKGPMKSSPTFKTMDDLIDGVDWKSMEQTRRFNEGSNKPVDSLTENSLSDLEKKLKSHDWWYAYSDDNRKYKSGETNWFEITKMIKGMKGNKEAEKLWNKYVPKDFNYSFKELSETQLDEGIFKIGIKHIIPLIPTGYAPNDPKYKMDLRILRNMLNSFYNERGYDKVILPTF